MTLESFLKILISGSDVNPELNRYLTEQLRNVAWQIFRDAGKAKFVGGKIDAAWLQGFIQRHVPNSGHGKSAVSRDRFLPASSDVMDYGEASAKPITVPNMGSEVVDRLYGDLPDIGMSITVKYNRVSLELTQTEGHIVVGLLGEVLLQARDIMTSGLGKKLELPLMLTLAKLYQVPFRHYAGKGLSGEGRDVDFHFIDPSEKRYRCEVKLMGKGNPESADAVVARDTDIFIADTLSSLNKEQLPQRGCYWVELRADEGYKKIFEVFTELGIPCVEFDGDLGCALDSIIPEVFAELEQAR